MTAPEDNWSPLTTTVEHQVVAESGGKILARSRRRDNCSGALRCGKRADERQAIHFVHGEIRDDQLGARFGGGIGLECDLGIVECPNFRLDVAQNLFSQFKKDGFIINNIIDRLAFLLLCVSTVVVG